MTAAGFEEREAAFRQRQARKVGGKPTSAAKAPKTRSARQALDAYYTPDDCALACVRALDIEAGAIVVEPSVGGGAWVRALRATVEDVWVHGVDVDPKVAALQACDSQHVGDWLRADMPAGATWIVGNPPYVDAEAHIRRAMSAGVNVAFLLRLGMLASKGRVDFWASHAPTALMVLTQRPSFLGKGSDSTDYALFVWKPGTPRLPVSWLAWREPLEVPIGAAWGAR